MTSTIEASKGRISENGMAPRYRMHAFEGLDSNRKSLRRRVVVNKDRKESSTSLKL